MRTDFKRYPLTYILIASSSIVYLFAALLSRSLIDMELKTLVGMGALYGPLTVLHGEWWRLFTAMFLHGGMTHLLMNMFSLYLIGRGAESYFDAKSYLSIYFFSGFIGGLVSLYIHPVSVGVGASGAIFGIFGALAGFFLAHREEMTSYTNMFMKNFGMIIMINLAIGLSIPSIDVSAHIGGLAVGLTGGFLLAIKPKWIWFYSLTMVVLIVLIIAYLSSQYV